MWRPHDEIHEFSAMLEGKVRLHRPPHRWGIIASTSKPQGECQLRLSSPPIETPAVTTKVRARDHILRWRGNYPPVLYALGTKRLPRTTQAQQNLFISLIYTCTFMCSSVQRGCHHKGSRKGTSSRSSQRLSPQRLERFQNGVKMYFII